MLYSFDVFDTLITRITAEPEGIFTLMQEELLNNRQYDNIPYYVKNNFFELRIGAEKMARRHYIRNEIEDIRFEEVYEALSTSGYLNSNQLKDLCSLEKELEIKNAIPIRNNINIIEKLVKEKKHVVLITDMYFSKSFIKHLLLSVNPVFKNIPLYVSSEYRKCKSSKNLYRIVHELESVDYNNWKHIGDNIQADIIAPNELGIETEEYQKGKLWGIESGVLKANRNDINLQLMVGASKNIRTEYNYSLASQVGASMAAPILYPYIQWILKTCKEKSINRLYFIARDGYVLKIIADMVIKKLGLNVQTYYIYGSRRSWRMAAYDGSKDSLHQMIAISDPHRIKKLDDLAELLQIDINELLLFTKDFYFLKNNVDHESLRYIVYCLVENDKFRDFLVKKHQKCRDCAIKYLKQEVDLCDDKYAFVELRGSGYTTKCLADLMKIINETPIRVFYYNLVSLGMTGNSKCYNYKVGVLSEGIILELLCRATHGQTNGYEYYNGKMVPILGKGEGELLKSYGYDNYIDGIKKYVEKVLGFIDLFCNESSIYKISDYYMEYVSNTPDKCVLDFLSDMPFYLSAEATDYRVFAPRLTINDIRDIYLCNNYSRYNGVSLTFSEMRTSQIEKKRINFYKNNRDRIKHRFQSINHCQLTKKNEHNILVDEFIRINMAGKTIVIYGAGKNGQRLYHISKQNNCNIVGWLDNKFIYKENDNYVTGTIEDVNKIDFDVIIVTIMDRVIGLDIKRKLLELGVIRDKIKFFDRDLWYNIYLNNNVRYNKVVLCGSGEFYDSAKDIVENACFTVQKCIDLDNNYSIDRNINDFYDAKIDVDTYVVVLASELANCKSIKRSILIRLKIPSEKIIILFEKDNVPSGYLNVW